MNISEIQILSGSSISLAARVLYTVGITPFSSNGSIVLNYHDLTPSVTVNRLQNDGITRTMVPNAGELNAMVQELIDSGLLVPTEIPTYKDWWDGMRMNLPLHETIIQQDRKIYSMYEGWHPDHNFENTCRISGLFNKKYSEIELAEFASYWIGRPEIMLDNHRWNLRFIQYLKRIRNL